MDPEGLELNVRYFVIEDGVDVSAYDSFESAVLAIEPGDIPRMKLFDELGNEYALSVGRKHTRFLWIWPSTVDSTTASDVSCAAALELENCLREYASKATIQVPTDAGLTELVKLIATPPQKKCHPHPMPAAKAVRARKS